MNSIISIDDGGPVRRACEVPTRVADHDAGGTLIPPNDLD